MAIAGSQRYGLSGRAWRFFQKPWQEKYRSFYFRWIRVFPDIPVPVRLPFGGWWLARNDYIGATMFYDGLERAERLFVTRFLRPGMTVLDVGAHQGYYTLLASRKVGKEGRVVAFEPSPREYRRLRLHLRINGCRNVETDPRALGETAGAAELYQVLGSESGCNSLRRPEVPGKTQLVPVKVESLDGVLGERGIKRVDFIKLDVEGAELAVLQGARDLLEGRPRPVILAEVQDIRTQPWGYPAREIVQFLDRAGFELFEPLAEGILRSVDKKRETFDSNLVAVPRERLGEVLAQESSG